MKVPFAQLREKINAVIGDRQDDLALEVLEAVADTLTDETDWETKYNSLDADWRKRYRERFNNSEKPENESDKPNKPDETNITFDDIIKEEK